MASEVLSRLGNLLSSLDYIVDSVSFASKDLYDLFFNEVWEIAFTPPPPSDGVKRRAGQLTAFGVLINGNSTAQLKFPIYRF